MAIRRRISDPGGFERRVGELRIRRQKTLAALGEDVGVSGTCVWNWESGNTFPRPGNLAALAKALETTTKYLVAGDLTEEASPPVENFNSTLKLQDTILLARESIAAVAGLPPAKVRVVLDYDG